MQTVTNAANPASNAFLKKDSPRDGLMDFISIIFNVVGREPVNNIVWREFISLIVLSIASFSVAPAPGPLMLILGASTPLSEEAICKLLMYFPST